MALISLSLLPSPDTAPVCEDVLAINSGHCLARNVPEAFLVDGLHRAEEDISLFRVGEAPPVALPKASKHSQLQVRGGERERPSAVPP